MTENRSKLLNIKIEIFGFCFLIGKKIVSQGSNPPSNFLLDLALRPLGVSHLLFVSQAFNVCYQIIWILRAFDWSTNVFLWRYEAI